MARIAITAAGMVAGAAVGWFFPPAGVAMWQAVIGGAMAGSSVGRVAASLLDPLHTQGPRLNDLSISSSANGVVIPFGYGTFRVSGNIIWAPGLVVNNEQEKDGSTTYNYYASFAAAFCQGPANIVRIWGDSTVIYEGGGPAYFPSKYFAEGSAVGWLCGLCGAFTDAQGNLIEAVWVGHGSSFTVPEGATVFQLGINTNYQCTTAGGFPVKVSCSDGANIQVYVPSTALPWECVGAQNAAYPFGDVGGTSPVVALQNLQAGETVTVGAIPNPGAQGDGTNYQQNEGGYEGQITPNATVQTTAEGRSSQNTIQWYGPDGETDYPTGSMETAPPQTIYPTPDLFQGTQGQEPMLLIQESEGIENTPAFRGICYAAWENFPLGNFGNRIPNIRAEIAFSKASMVNIPPTIQQRAFARATFGSVTLHLNNPPTEGNTLVFLVGGNGGGYQGQMITANFDTDSGLNHSAGFGFNVASWSWWRTVRAGDGQDWSFTVANLSAPVNFFVFEVAGVKSIQGCPGTPSTMGYGEETLCTVPPVEGGTLVLGILAFSFLMQFDGELTPSIYRVLDVLGDNLNDCAVTFSASGYNMAGPITANLLRNNGVNECWGASVLALQGSVPTAADVPTGDLGQAVLDICLRSGLTASQVDVSRLVGQSIIGYVCGRVSTGQQCLQPLATAYFFDGVEVDGKLTFIPRGQESCMDIPEADLGLLEDHAEYTEGVGQEQDLPREVQVTYADPAISYQQAKQERRRSVKVVKTRNHVVYELPMALEADTALQIAEKSVYLSYLERRPITFNLWKALYNMLVPTDVIRFTGRGVTQQVRIQRASQGAGRTMAITSVSEMPKVYLSQALAGHSSPGTGGPAPLLVPVTLLLFDLPLLADSDSNASGTGYYFGVTAPAGFTKAQLYASSDGTEFATEGPVIGSALSYGVALNTLGAPASPWALDSVNTLQVRLVAGSFASATQSQLIEQGVNFLLVGSEVIQFETAEQQTDGSWILSGLLRGRRGTDSNCGSHVASENVILLGVPGLIRVARPDALLDTERYYRCVPNGNTISAAVSQEWEFTGKDLMPWSPVAIGGSQDASGNWTICWLRRTRFGGAYGTGAEALVDGLGGPLNETAEKYEVDIIAAGVVKRTLTVSSPTAVYPASMQQADFGGPQSALTVKVYQISAVVGRGFAGAASLPETTDATPDLPGDGQFYINGE